MTLLITPNGFPLLCSKVEFETVAREVNRVLNNGDTVTNMSFEQQLDMLSVFTWAFDSVGSFFKPIVKYPNLAISPTVVSYLTMLATDLERTTKPSRDTVLWSSLFRLKEDDANHKPVSVKSLKLISNASVYTPHLIVVQLSKILSISEIMDMMGILFGNYAGE